MSRYIDAEKIELRFPDGYDNDGLLYVPFRSIQKCIDNTPTADVEEVKHGKDIYYTVCDKHCEFKCSVCNAWIGVVEGGTLDAARGFNYCPACGAKMKKEK